ncbi:hypothetical protein NPIL_541362 [Nephila pilipes]|uniref:Uncharacterized protein n=1 Tax=Nephila pilipes TaxID=299642 RepID=A0A8X6QGF3_NEPPI|nr:hypothetical protein NPIL_541362 [Nephila pilipes]
MEEIRSAGSVWGGMNDHYAGCAACQPDVPRTLRPTMALKVAMAAETPSADMMSKVLFFLPFNGERYLAGKRHRSDNTENAGIVARSRTGTLSLPAATRSHLSPGLQSAM